MLRSKGNDPQKGTSFDTPDQPVLLAWLARFTFLRRASTQSWLVATNLLFLIAISFSIALFIHFYSTPRLRQLEVSEIKRQAEYLKNALPTARTLTDVQTQLDMVSGISGIQIVLELSNGNVVRSRNSQKFSKGTSISYKVLFPQLSGYPKGNLKVYYGHSVFFHEVNRNGNYILLFAILISITFVWLASWLASHKITQPLQKIILTARRINAGHLDEEIRIDTQAAEIQDLADSLNLMSRRFRLDILELKRLTRFQNEFIGNVSHEVRNPIFSIGGYLEALASDNLTPKMRQMYVGKGLNNVQRLNSLFSDLLEIARLEYREETIKPDQFDLKSLLEEVADELDYLAKEKNIDLVVDNEHQQVFADRSRIRQVLMNLIHNALKYTDNANGTVRVRYRRNGNKVRVEVMDTGRGIAEEHLDRVFERFYRVDAARSRAMGGTGLGLSIVKQILNAHGENIHVESTEGRGSRFWFELPISASVSSANSI